MEYSFLCSACNGTSTIERYSVNGVGPVFRCDHCSKVVCVHEGVCYSLVQSDKIDWMQERIETYLEAQLKRCECGGVFSLTAPPRCRLCSAPIALSDLEAQIGPYFKDTPGFLGLVITAGKVALEEVLSDPTAI